LKKIAILGASYLQKPLFDKANSIGIETHCFAWDNEEAICKHHAHYFYPISVLDKELILQKCIEIGIDGITTIATDICIPTIAFVAEKMTLYSNSYRSSMLSTNKALMRKAFYENNVNSPKSRVASGCNVLEFADFSFPLIVKPTDRSGSRGVTKVENNTELEAAIFRGLNESLEKKVVVEEFITGVEVSVETISWKGNHTILAITDKVTTGSPYFVELEHHQPSLLSDAIQENIIKETLKALNALNIEMGASHSEFKITDSGEVYAIEVGARMGGDFIGSHLVALSTGYDFLKGVIEIALGTFNPIEYVSKNHSGVYFLCKETEQLKPFFEMKNQFDVEKKITNATLKNITNSNERSGYLIYKNNVKVNLK
jgi:biotin carboxylase